MRLFYSLVDFRTIRGLGRSFLAHEATIGVLLFGVMFMCAKWGYNGDVPPEESKYLAKHNQ